MNESNFTEATENEHSEISCNVSNRTAVEVGGLIACTFIFLTSLLGNTLVITVVYNNRKMRTIVNLLIVNIAVSDLLNTVVVIPRVMTQTLTYPSAWFITGTVGEALCKIVFFFHDFTVAVSLLSLLMIAIERHNAICRPTIADPNSRKRCALMILSTWLVAFLIYSTHFYTFKLFTEDEGTLCDHTWRPLFEDPSKALEIEFLLVSIIFVFVPFTVVTSLYTIILIRIRKLSVPDEASSVGQRRREKRNRKVLRMLLIVVIAFGFCWFPYIINEYVVIYFWYNKDLEPPCGVQFFEECTLYLTYLNSSINPAIYFAFSENFRKGLSNLNWPCRFSPFPAIPSKQTSRQIDGVAVAQAKEMELQPL